MQLRFFLLSCCTFLLLVGCGTTMGAKASIKRSEKSVGWCVFLKQAKLHEILAGYEEAASIEDAILTAFRGDLHELERWDQVTFEEYTYVVGWTRRESVGAAIYSATLTNDIPLWIRANVSDYPPITLEDILSCLGTPDFHAVTPYLFPFSGYGENVDLVFMYYMNRDLELEVIKPRSQSIYDTGVQLRFTGLRILPPGELALQLPSIEYPSQDDLRVWEPSE